MSRKPRRHVPALLALTLSAGLVPAQANSGIIFSEIAHGPTLPPFAGFQMPSYIELVNVQIANPVIPPPVPIGSAAAGPATLTGRVGAQAPITVTIPTGFFVGGNVQPLPAPQPPVFPFIPPVLVISSGPFPPGVLPLPFPPQLPVQVIQVPALFSGPNALLGAPGVGFELCFNNPATGQSDRIQLGSPAGSPCSTAPFNNTLTFQSANGRATRWTYMDSNTDIDFDNGFSPSPGGVNPQMAHVNGFFFGTTTSPPLGGTPLIIIGTTAGTLTFPPNAIVKSVHFFNSFLDRKITNPAFDAVINAPVTLLANYVAQPGGFLPSLQILNESLMITATTPAGLGVLSMPSGFSTQVGSVVGQSYLAPGDIRPERLFSDLGAGGPPFVLGASPTAAEIDVLPASTGAGNIWCEVIAFDLAGNEYRAKVKNWPPGGACIGSPLIGLGTDGSQSFTLIDLCFNPGSMIANLFSTSPVATCASGLFPPFGGICPDLFTVWILSPPQLGSLPFFPTADSGGLYYFHLPSSALAGLAGLTFEAIGVEYTLAGTIVQQSGVTSITL